MDDDKEHSTLELDSETCSDSQGWVGGKIYCRLGSSTGRDGETEDEATRTSVA